MSKQSINQIVN